MVRDQIKVDVPDEWMENLKHGRCWCGKDHTEFDKNQKFYCSQDHADQYSKRIVYWSNFKEKIIRRDKGICQKCGRDEKAFEIAQEAKKKTYYLAKAAEYPKAVEMARALKLQELQEQHEKIMDDAYVMEHMSWHVSEELGLPRINYDKRYFMIEVDHIIAVALGGDMWDENNCRCLCNDCHKDKTKSDMLKIKTMKKEKESPAPKEREKLNTDV